MEFREFVATNKELNSQIIELADGGAGLNKLGILSPVMKFWLVAMLVNLGALAVLF